MKRLASLLVLSALFFAHSAHAHPGHGAAAGFSGGLAHPAGGLDHVSAMLAIGLWASQLGGGAMWRVPLVFVLAAGGGAFLGMTGLPLPLVEPGILASVLALGVLITFAVRLPEAAGWFVASACAIFHGHAHGVEMPESASGAAYVLGFLLATAALHGAGIGLGRALRRPDGTPAVRWAGAGVTACGLYLCLV